MSEDALRWGWATFGLRVPLRKTTADPSASLRMTTSFGRWNDCDPTLRKEREGWAPSAMVERTSKNQGWATASEKIKATSTYFAYSLETAEREIQVIE
jgi:hypothetical protein